MRRLLDGASFVTSVSGRRGRVLSFIGEGGQGCVYKVDIEGAVLAMKWCHPHAILADRGLRARLERSIRMGPPAREFLWPIDLVDRHGDGGFGYVMPLRTETFVSIRDVIARDAALRRLSLATQAFACHGIARSFLALHAAGYCYHDVNFGNIFLDPGNGHVRICDTDNVDVDGIPSSVYGTRKFMAPEVVRREALPDMKTDLYSIAVLFFYILTGGHPLDGAREAAILMLESADEISLYGTHPRFIFDPDDNSNGPAPGIHDAIVEAWTALTPGLRDLFLISFTEGLRHPRSRVLETAWCKAFADLADGLATCPTCAREMALDMRRLAETQIFCPFCGRQSRRPAVLTIGRDHVVLQLGAVVYDHRINPTHSFDTGIVTGRVERHPTRSDILGLRNLSERPWNALQSGGKTIEVPPGRTVRIAHGMHIDFGSRSGNIDAPELAEARST